MTEGERSSDLTSKPEYAIFLSDRFDANDYANSVLSKEAYNPSGLPQEETNEVAVPTDVGSALAKLNGGIDALNAQLRQEITSNHSDLLLQAASVTQLETSLTKVRSGLHEVDNGVDRLRKKISVPYNSLSTSITRLGRLNRISDLVRRAARIVLLARRLQVQMKELESVPSNKDRALAEAALTLSEIESITQEHIPESESDTPLSIRSIRSVDRHMPAIEAARERVTDEMETMVRQGLSDSNQEMLASSLQTAHNLGVLPDLVSSLVVDLTEAVRMRIKASFDMSSLAREMGGKEAASSNPLFVSYKSRARTEPTNVTLPQWTLALWTRLDALIQDMSECCIKVYTLEKVLLRKRDSATQSSFLDLCLNTLDGKPSLIFWTALAQAFEAQAKSALKSSTFTQQTLGGNYPRLLRLLQEFFSKIGAHTDTSYTQSHQSPETVLLLRAVQPFETIYLNKSAERLNTAITAAFSLGNRTPPGATEGLAAGRAMANELDSARFDPLLVKSVAKNVAKATEAYVSRIDGLIARDYSATSLLGPVSGLSQSLNAELINALYHFWQPLYRTLASDFPASTGIPDVLSPSVGKVRSTLFSVAAPLLGAIRREFSNILARMHKVNFEKPSANEAGSSSPYMKDLADKLVYVRGEIFGPLKIGDMSKDWAIDLARFLLRDFILHASLVRPIGESGKLKLVSDLTSLEFSVNQLLSDHKVGMVALGEDFTTLRAFRPFLFIETSDLTNAQQTASIPFIVLVHQVIVRSSLPLPHKANTWSQAEYVRWLNEHEDADKLKLIDNILVSAKSDEEDEGAALLRKLLARHKGVSNE